MSLPMLAVRPDIQKGDLWILVATALRALVLVTFTPPRTNVISV